MIISVKIENRRAKYDAHSVQEAAFYLRSLIMKTQSKQEDLPSPITTEALHEGQVDIHGAIIDFFRVLYTGSKNPNVDERIERLEKSMSDDDMFVATRARSTSRNHLCIALKSLTGSRKVIEILNRFGHCISYHTSEASQTELATDISGRNYATPAGITKLVGLCIRLEWDNYDELTLALSGGGTLHDTVGFYYQNEPSVTQNEPLTSPRQLSSLDNYMMHSSLSKRTFHPMEHILEPYRKN